MGMKIWSLEKLQKILEMVLEPDPYKSMLIGQGTRSASLQAGLVTKTAEPSNLLQLLQNERVHGPSDRDPTVTTKELHYFKGPYVYVYDIEEKQKPIMVREYTKVADKKNGDWPQFRVASQGRCPFIEDVDVPERDRGQPRAKERVSKAAVEAKAPVLQPVQPPPAKPVTGKRTLSEMEDGHNRGGIPILRPVATVEAAKPAKPQGPEFLADNAFTSRAKAGRLFAGEPVASGVQPSHVTSAIRSQMISSTTGALGAKAGTSKEIHGLQRKVLQKNSIPAISHASQDLSSRRRGDMSHDSNTFIRSASLGQATHRKLDMIDEDDPKPKLQRTESAPAPAPTKQRKRDPKPGYCENCQDKFDDFDDVSYLSPPYQFEQAKTNR
jgi:regulatory subunit for Cdc7p protein kinase